MSVSSYNLGCWKKFTYKVIVTSKLSNSVYQCNTRFEFAKHQQEIFVMSFASQFGPLTAASHFRSSVCAQYDTRKPVFCALLPPCLY